MYRGKKRLLNTPRGGKVNIDEIVADTDLVVLSQVRGWPASFKAQAVVAWEYVAPGTCHTTHAGLAVFVLC